ncbi:hypothetical protein RB195_019390 [Necator americanus]|uniref:Uncharacterized protein n=1 Tax=Necator americanus TaxID=51031 RepID=A0ABR1CEY9_NECAM
MHSLLVLVALSTLLVAMSVQQIDQQNRLNCGFTCTRKAAFRVNIDGAMTTTTCTANGADPRDRCSGCCQSRALAAGLLTTDAAGFPSTNGNDCICCIFNKCSLR